MMNNKNYRDGIKQINLAEFAQCYGFQLNKKKSSRSNPVLKKDDTGHTVVVKSHPNGHFTFFESSNEAKGTIIDFLLWQGVEYAGIPKIIAAYQQGKIKPANRVKIMPSGKASTHRKSFSMRPYGEATKGRLEDRYIHSDLIASALFDNRIGSINGTGCFPLFNSKGICGLRKTDQHIVAGSVRGLWVANRPDLCGLASSYSIFITESPIDNISYEQMHGGNHYHLATNGNPTAGQLETIRFIADVTQAPVLLGFDNDEKGEEFAHQVEQLLKGIVPVERVRPMLKDWNDDLKAACQKQPLASEAF